MAVKGITALTLADWGKRIDPNGKVDKIIELLSQTNPILQDMLIVEGNLPTGHRTTIRSGLPSATASAQLRRPAEQIDHCAGYRWHWHAGNLCGD